MTVNDESAIMDALALRLKVYSTYYTDANVSIVSYNILDAGAEHAVIITENTIGNANDNSNVYMGGQFVTYTFTLRVLAKQNRKDDTGSTLRTYVRRVRTIIDSDHTLGGAVQACRTVSASRPDYLFREGGGPYYRYRDVIVEVKMVETFTPAILTEGADPITVS